MTQGNQMGASSIKLGKEVHHSEYYATGLSQFRGQVLIVAPANKLSVKSLYAHLLKRLNTPARDLPQTATLLALTSVGSFLLPQVQQSAGQF